MRYELDPLSATGISKVSKSGYQPYFAGGPGKPSLLDSVNGKHGAVQIVAGSNVTVDNTAKDTISISATGGGERVITTTDDATAVIDVDVTDVYELSAVANATTFTLTGTPTDGQKLMVRFKDAGVAKGLTWTGFTAIGVTLPTTTVAGKWHYCGFQYNLAATAWHAIAVGAEA